MQRRWMGWIACATLALASGRSQRLHLQPASRDRPAPPAPTAGRAAAPERPKAEAPRGLRLLTPAEWQAVMEAGPPLERQTPPEPWAAGTGKVAFGGFDVVAYFRLGQAVEGRKEFVHQYEGFALRFASVEHREAFRNQPGDYLPQFGGYCAYQMAKGRVVPGDPHRWRIVSGRLYFAETESLLRNWDRDAALLVPLAERSWGQAQRAR